MSYLEIPQLLNIATIACIGLLVGSEICLTAFTNPVLREIDEPARVKAAHLLTARLTIMPPLERSRPCAAHRRGGREPQ